MKITGVMLLLLLVGLCAADVSFTNFMSQYNKVYTGEELALRSKIFHDNVKYIEQHNSVSTFKLGINEFADMSHDEFVKAKLATPVHVHHSVVEDHSSPRVGSAAPPASLDWRSNTNPAIVGPVRTSGQCDSALVDSIIDSISSDYAVAAQDDVYTFDPAYVLDCDGQPKCSGQTAAPIWSFIAKFGLNWYYTQCPTGAGLGLCINGNNYTKSGNEADLQATVAHIGPVSISIDASRPSFQLYTSGVYYDAACSSTALSHSLLLVGYGTQNGQDYWIARNSWGTSWGMKGDILIARNKNNQCGVATSACYAKNVHTCVCEL